MKYHIFKLKKNTMRIAFLVLIFGIFSIKAQTKLMYYPRLNDTYLSNQSREYNDFIYKKTNLVAELSKISQKTFYSNFIFSNSINGYSSFTGLELVPLIQNYDNFFIPGFTLNLLGDKEKHIGLTYTENFKGDSNEDNKINSMESILQLNDADKISLSMPLHLLNATGGNGEYKGEFYFSRIESVINRNNFASFTISGKFSKEFYLKNRQINSLKISDLVFECKENNLIIKAGYSTANESRTEAVIFTAPFIL